MTQNVTSTCPPPVTNMLTVSMHRSQAWRKTVLRLTSSTLQDFQYGTEWHMCKMQAQKMAPSEFTGVLGTHWKLNATLLGGNVQMTVLPLPLGWGDYAKEAGRGWRAIQGGAPCISWTSRISAVNPTMAIARTNDHCSSSAERR
jgi:hypothetical protein